MLIGISLKGQWVAVSEAKNRVREALLRIQTRQAGAFARLAPIGVRM
jgi:hypothetical protein